MEKLETIYSQTVRASELISHFRVFGRLPSRSPSEFDARRACENAKAMIGNQFRDKDIVVECVLEQKGAPMLGHQTLLEQVIINLCNNARDAMISAGASDCHIYIRCAVVHDKIQLEVEDTGPGISPELRDRVFEPFFTTKEVGHGTGLGLSVSYGIVKEMNGILELVPSHLGARFRMEFPLAEK